jgi:ribosomal protein S18 acetylase RimI-like enzyme
MNTDLQLYEGLKPIVIDDPVRNRCRVELYRYTLQAWQKIRENIMSLETDVFGENGFDEDELVEDFNSRDNTVVLVRDVIEDKIVGYTCVSPLSRVCREDRWEIFRDDHGAKTAYISNILVDPQFQGHHLAADMMDFAEELIGEKGFEYIEADVVVKNGFAGKITKAYQGKILYHSGSHISEYGDQEYFRIQINI